MTQDARAEPGLMKKIPYTKNHHKEQAASMIEYILLVALIAIVALVVVKFTGNSVNKTFVDLKRDGFDAAGGLPCLPSNPLFPNCQKLFISSS